MIRVFLIMCITSLLLTLEVVFCQSNEFWVKQNSGTTNNLNDIFFINEHTGWIVGHNGTILSTTDGGNHWSSQNSNTTQNLHAIFFINPDKGWSVGANGTVLYTYNGGNDWASQNINGTFLIKSIFFIDDSTGWLCGDSFPSVYKTTDGGNHWSCLSTNEYRNNSIFFINPDKGWIAGPGVASTDNGGTTWSPCNVDLNSHAIYFIDIDSGWVVGSPYAAFRTINGGNSWMPMTMNSCLWLNDIHFIDQNYGWAAGDGVYKSINGGINWEKVHSENIFTAVFFIDKYIGWAIGSNGSIFKSVTGGSASVPNYSDRINNSNKFFHIKNYPNPFNAATTIQYKLKESGNILLTIYNLSGEKIETILNEFQTKGEYKLTWMPKLLSNGIYFIQIQTGEFSESSKLILME